MRGIITTHSGLNFNLEAPTQDSICIEDIAHHLGHLCRFTGAIDRFYSVAEHSVWVSHMVPKHFALLGLLHDGTEAYLGDVSKPLKELLPHYQKLEGIVWNAIATKFNEFHYLPFSVKYADKQAYVRERFELFSSRPGTDDGLHPKYDGIMIPDRPLDSVPPGDGKYLFMRRYAEIKDGL